MMVKNGYVCSFPLGLQNIEFSNDDFGHLTNYSKSTSILQAFFLIYYQVNEERPIIQF